MDDNDELKTLLPQIVDKSGKEIIRPDVLQSITQLAQLGQLVKIRKSLEKEEYQGKIDTRVIEATDALGFLDLVNNYPNTPWINVFLINDGPDKVYLRINKSEEIKMGVGETRTIDHTHAEQRIEQVYYKCDEGETASVRVEGHY